MKAIQMVDLKTQYHKLKEEIDEAVIGVLESSAYINGKPVADLVHGLSKYLDVKHVIPCANGTDALQIAMMALDLQPGDEVITPSFTYIATVEVVGLLRLTPVFVDVDPITFCIDPAEIEKAITPKTKAIVPVHLYGQAANMEAIMQVAQKHNLFVIEDNAQAIGCDYSFSNGTKKKTGTIGTIGTTSFFPSKNLGAYGDGGAIFTNDDSLAEKLKMIANHGQSSRYYHEMVGCNSRLDTLQAAVLNIKLKHLDTYISARNKVADFYDTAFAGHKNISIPGRAKFSNHVFHQYTLVLKGADRNGLQEHLSSKNIPSMIYYPVACHNQNMFSKLTAVTHSMNVTDSLTPNVISLPIHTEMENEQLRFVTETVLEYLKK